MRVGYRALQTRSYKPGTRCSLRHLVAEGPYRFTRNPMYLGLALAYAGVALWFQLSWGLLLLPLMLTLIYLLVIAKEERYLERRFGEAYRRYRTQVRLWL